MKKKVIIVDDEIAVAGLIQHVVEDLGYETQVFNDSQYAVKEIVKQEPFLVISDFSMPKLTGVDVLRECKEKNQKIEFIIMTGYATIESAVESMHLGALNYLQKPVNLDHLRHLVNQAAEKIELQDQNKNLKNRLNDQNALSTIVGTSPQITQVYDLIRKVAPSDASVLVTGESGTGKELVARAIHNCSPEKS